MLNIRDSIIKRRRVDIPLNGLILPFFCACPKPVPGFPMSYISCFFLSSVCHLKINDKMLLIKLYC
jgi:hypothetical protein